MNNNYLQFKVLFSLNFNLNLIMNLSDNIVFENELKAAYYDMIEEYTPKYYKGFEKDLEELILNKNFIKYKNK